MDPISRLETAIASAEADLASAEACLRSEQAALKATRARVNALLQEEVELEKEQKRLLRRLDAAEERVRVVSADKQQKLQEAEEAGLEELAELEAKADNKLRLLQEAAAKAVPYGMATAAQLEVHMGIVPVGLYEEVLQGRKAMEKSLKAEEARWERKLSRAEEELEGARESINKFLAEDRQAVVEKSLQRLESVEAPAKESAQAIWAYAVELKKRLDHMRSNLAALKAAQTTP